SRRNRPIISAYRPRGRTSRTRTGIKLKSRRGPKWTSPSEPDGCLRFSPHCAQSSRCGRKLPYGIARFSCGRPNIRNTRFAKPGVREPNADAGATDGLCGGAAGDLYSRKRRLGTDGRNSRKTCIGQRGFVSGCSAGSVENTCRQEFQGRGTGRSQKAQAYFEINYLRSGNI